MITFGSLYAESNLIEGNVIEFAPERSFQEQEETGALKSQNFFIAFDYETAYLVDADKRLPKEMDGCALSLNVVGDDAFLKNKKFVTEAGVRYSKIIKASLHKVIGCPDPETIKKITVRDEQGRKLRW